MKERWRAALVGVSTFLLIALGVGRYGLIWDEPTYFGFARLQRDWFGDLLASLVHPARWSELFSPERIGIVFLQDRMKNGHPPLHEVWQALGGLPFHWLGLQDVIAFRLANGLLAGATAALLYLLARRALSVTSSLAAVLVYVGVPCVWAHAHLGATETMQNLFWVAGAFVAKPALDRGGRWLAAMFLVCAFGFAAKFTNLLMPICLLGLLGISGGLRERRYWLMALLCVVVAPLMLPLIDPYFWPWQGGLARFGDYLEQVATRGKWVPISVFYLGKNWGFRPPWHYRIVELLGAMPIVLLPLFLGGLVIAGREWWASARLSWRERVRLTPRAWLAAVGLGGVVFSLAIGWLPSAPNHDGTRQFIFVFVPAALLAALTLDAIARELSRRRVGARWLPVAVLLLPAIGLLTSLRVEPFGLAYRSEWLGGIAGAWRRGFDLEYWGGAITPKLLEEVAAMHGASGDPPYILSVPKLDFFEAADDLWRGLVPDVKLDTLAVDASPAYYSAWATPELRQRGRVGLRLSSPRPLDGILVFYRRSWVEDGFQELMSVLVTRGDLRLIDETRVDGLVLAQLFAVERSIPVRLPGDPTGKVWYVPASVPELVGYPPKP